VASETYREREEDIELVTLPSRSDNGRIDYLFIEISYYEFACLPILFESLVFFGFNYQLLLPELIDLDIQDVFSKKYVLSLVDRVSSAVLQSKIDKDGYSKQKLAINLVKLGERTREPVLVQRGKKIIDNLTLNQQYNASLSLAEYYGRDHPSKNAVQECFGSASRVLQHCIKNQPITTETSGISPQKLVGTVLKLDFPSQFDQYLALARDYILRMTVSHQPRAFLELAETVIAEPKLASNW